MIIDDVVKLLDEAWAKSQKKFGAALDGQEEEADIPTKDKDESGLTKIFTLLDESWNKSKSYFEREEQKKCLEALFPLYLLKQIDQLRPLESHEWSTWVDQVNNDLENIGEKTLSGKSCDELLRKFHEISELITPELMDKEDISDAHC